MHLRYILVLDFEATCDDTGLIIPRNESEIIELPTLLYDVDEDKVHDVFHEYVWPIRHPTLTTFCTGLTGIEQVCFLSKLKETSVLTASTRTQLTLRILFLLCGSGTNSS